MDKSRFVEKILETENLTDNLEDADANVLLDWGLGHLNTVIDYTGDDETAGNQVLALMNAMRAINRIIGSFPVPNPEGLKEFIEWYDCAFATSHNTYLIESEIIASQLTGMSSAEALLFLLTWLKPANLTDLSVEPGE